MADLFKAREKIYTRRKPAPSPAKPALPVAPRWSHSDIADGAAPATPPRGRFARASGVVCASPVRSNTDLALARVPAARQQQPQQPQREQAPSAWAVCSPARAGADAAAASARAASPGGSAKRDIRERSPWNPGKSRNPGMAAACAPVRLAEVLQQRCAIDVDDEVIVPSSGAPAEPPVDAADVSVVVPASGAVAECPDGSATVPDVETLEDVFRGDSPPAPLSQQPRGRRTTRSEARKLGIVVPDCAAAASPPSPKRARHSDGPCCPARRRSSHAGASAAAGAAGAPRKPGDTEDEPLDLDDSVDAADGAPPRRAGLAHVYVAGDVTLPDEEATASCAGGSVVVRCEYSGAELAVPLASVASARATADGASALLLGPSGAVRAVLQFKAPCPAWLHSLPVVIEVEAASEEDVQRAIRACATEPPAGEGPVTRARAARKRPASERPVLRYPRGAPDAVTLTKADVDRLEPNVYLNDSIIEFYLRYIEDHVIAPGLRGRVQIFNPFIYKCMLLSADAYSRVERWTRGTNVFERDYLFIPIHEREHWSLVVACLREGFGNDREAGRCLLFLDSLSSTSTSVTSKRIRAWLSSEHRSRFKDSPEVFTCENMPAIAPEVPRQTNYTDCGVFLLHYTEMFVRNPPKTLEELRHWFPEDDVAAKRQFIRDIIRRLVAEDRAADGAVSSSGSAHEDSDAAPAEDDGDAGLGAESSEVVVLETRHPEPKPDLSTQQLEGREPIPSEGVHQEDQRRGDEGEAIEVDVLDTSTAERAGDGGKSAAAAASDGEFCVDLRLCPQGEDDYERRTRQQQQQQQQQQAQQPQQRRGEGAEERGSGDDGDGDGHGDGACRSPELSLDLDTPPSCGQ
eukprot:m51a1_g10265 putative sentrin-specific protease (860) ;mRNA; r:18261-22058